jgi:hypothetical protein
MSLTEIASVSIGVAGLLIGIYQTIAARSAKKMYRNNCRMRIKDATDKTGRLADNVVQLCRFINWPGFARMASQDVPTVRAYADLSAHVGATLDVAKGWVRFCLRLNEEHLDEFKESAISDEEIKHLRDLKECMHQLDEMSKIENNPQMLNEHSGMSQ